MQGFAKELRTVVEVSAMYVLVALLFTGMAQLVSPVSSELGTLRELTTIPGHLSLILGFGLLLGLCVSIVQFRFDPTLTLIIPVLAILTDVDHLPSILGVMQPIRPAHSFVFAAAIAVLIFLVLRRPDLSVAALSGFSAHLAIDTGLFPPFSPLSFTYYDLGGLRAYFIAAAVFFALLAGLLAKKRRLGKPSFLEVSRENMGALGSAQ